MFLHFLCEGHHEADEWKHRRPTHKVYMYIFLQLGLYAILHKYSGVDLLGGQDQSGQAIKLFRAP